MLIEPALDHLLAGRLDGGESRTIPAAQLMIGPCRGQLHRAVGMDQPPMHRPPGQREVPDGALGMNAPQRIGRDITWAEEVSFLAEKIAHGTYTLISLAAASRRFRGRLHCGP